MAGPCYLSTSHFERESRNGKSGVRHGRSVADPLAEPSSFFPFTPQRGRLGLEPGLDAEF